MPRLRHFLTLVGMAALTATAQPRPSIRPSDDPSLGRRALVIGNTAYSTAPLAHAAGDARVIADRLRDLHFEVSLVLEAKRDSMLRAMDDFVRRLRPRDLAFFY